MPSLLRPNSVASSSSPPPLPPPPQALPFLPILTSLVEYLVDTCGFSADHASKVSKSLPRFRSTKKPDAVVGFFRSQGIDGANLRKLITWKPKFLGWDVEKYLAPKFNFLRDMGFSESDAVNVVMLHPFILSLSFQDTLLSRLKVWQCLFESEIHLRNRRSCNRFMSNLDENMVRPNLNFLRDECGISEELFYTFIKRNSSLLMQNPDALRALVDRTEGLGVPRGSRMFLWTIDVLHGAGREKFEAHLKLMNNFGWSNSDFITAIQRCPRFLLLSIESLQRKMEFLVNDVGISPSDIVYSPAPLVLSLEKRLIPRFHVMEIFKSEGLWKSTYMLNNFFKSPGPNFLREYVRPYQDMHPKLLEVLSCEV